MLQQVDALLHDRRNGIQISKVYVMEDTLRFDSFTARRGCVELPCVCCHAWGLRWVTCHGCWVPRCQLQFVPHTTQLHLPPTWHCSIMAVPAVAEDSMSSLQDLFNRVAVRSLYCATEIPAFNTGSALEAAFIAIYRCRTVRCHQRIGNTADYACKSTCFCQQDLHIRVVANVAACLLSIDTCKLVLAPWAD